MQCAKRTIGRLHPRNSTVFINKILFEHEGTYEWQHHPKKVQKEKKGVCEKKEGKEWLLRMDIIL